MGFELQLVNRQRGERFDLSRIRAIATAAYPDCRAAVKSSDAPLASLDRVEVSLLSDAAIAVVHGEFFDDPTPTDVITFHHGELLIGAGVVAENCREYGHSPTDEAALCVIHGLLHLAGWEDLTKKDASAMARRQERIFKRACDMVGQFPA